MVVIVLASVLGTLIPQQEKAVVWADRFSPEVFSVLHALQVFDVFHSFWFILLMIILGCNLIVCSLNRIPSTWRMFQRMAQSDQSLVLASVPPGNVVATTKDVGEASVRIKKLLERRYKRVVHLETDHEVRFYISKNAFSYFGVYLVHFGILVILCGMIVSSLFSFDAYVQIMEGEAADTVYLRNGKGSKTLDFEVRCEAFSIDYYNNGMPKSYRSDLSFLKDGRVIEKAQLMVNHPVAFEGIWFYQSGYGMLPVRDAAFPVETENLEGRFVFFTVLKAHRDSGGSVVGVGAACLIIGFLVVFFYDHRQLWITVAGMLDKTHISIAGKSNRNNAGLQREIAQLVSAITMRES